MQGLRMRFDVRNHERKLYWRHPLAPRGVELNVPIRLEHHTKTEVLDIEVACRGEFLCYDYRKKLFSIIRDLLVRCVA